MKTKETPMLDLNLLKKNVQYFRSFSRDNSSYGTNNKLTESYDRYRSRSTSRHSNTNCNISSQNRYRAHSRDRYRYDRTTTPPQFNRSRYDNYRRASRSHHSPYRASYRSPYRQDSRHRYKSRSYSRDGQFPQYTSSYRPPSQPRQSRPFRSRSGSETRNKNNNIQTEQSNSPINIEIHMYHPTEMANALTPTSWFYSLYLHTPERHNDDDYSSRLEISFLLNSGASISVFNYPTYLTIAKLLNITCNNKTNHTSKALTVANQTEIPILHYITATLNTSIEKTSRQFIITFAVTDIKYNILGSSFFDEYIQNINIQDFLLKFKYQCKDQPNTTKFTSLLSHKELLQSSLCYNSQEPILSNNTTYLFLL